MTTPTAAIGVTDERAVSVAARILSDRSAEACGVNRDDNWKIYSEDFIEDARAVLAAIQQPAAAPLSRWISVDERLPEYNQTVIVFFWPYNNRDNAQIVGQAEHVEGNFYTDDGDDHHFPSHWMPLPSAPGTPAAPVEQDAVREQLVAALKDCARHPRKAQREFIVAKALKAAGVTL
jgi:hypothetical protein